ASDASLFRGLDLRPQVQEQLRQELRSYPWWDLSNDGYYKLWCTPQRLASLSRIKTSTLLIVGERDGDAVKQCAGFLERAIPNCALAELKEVGHLSLIEQPQVMKLLLERHWSVLVSEAKVVQF